MFTVVTAVVELPVVDTVVVPRVIGVVDVEGTLEVARVLEFVNGCDIVPLDIVVELVVNGGIVELDVVVARVAEVSGVVLLVTGAVLVVAKVAGILQSVVVSTPVLGCFGVPGAMVNFCPMSNLSQSRPGLYCCKDENGIPKRSAIKAPYSPFATVYFKQGAVVFCDGGGVVEL